MEIIEGIEVIDFYISDDSVYVLERLTELRDNAEYSTLRNIIYNSKNRDEATERIKLEQEGIIFNKTVEIRIWADENIRQMLRFLGHAVGLVKIKEFDLMVNMIFGEWVREEEFAKGLGRANELRDCINNFNFSNFGDVSYLTLMVRNDIWEQVKEIGRHRGLNKEECLKLAIVRFLERRYDLVRQILM